MLDMTIVFTELTTFRMLMERNNERLQIDLDTFELNKETQEQHSISRAPVGAKKMVFVCIILIFDKH